MPLTRTTGILLHPTALPGTPACGTFGEPVREWVKMLSNNNIGIWQLLPLSPTDGTGSPYSSPSSFAINPWFLDANDLANEGFFPLSALQELPTTGEAHNSIKPKLDFSLANHRSRCIGQLLSKHWGDQNKTRHDAFNKWRKKNQWVKEHSLFMELRKQNNNLPWWEWPAFQAKHQGLRFINWKAKNASSIIEHQLIQWHLDRQWLAIRDLAKELGVIIFGDLPFYVARDSADVWANRYLFSIQANGAMELQSGVPPDYFSETGQLWGTPVYRWWVHRLNNFNWWRRRLHRQWQQFDLLRLDHFRALISYWAVDGKERNAIKGHWESSPGKSLLNALKKDCSGNLPLIAEDLGVITKEVEKLRDDFNLPGMKILQFAFDGNKQNPYLPENIIGNNWVVYTGTHDNPTTLGWWEKLDQDSKDRVFNYVKNHIEAPGWQLTELALETDAFLVVVPIQDLLHLNDEARFNTPGTTKGNWSWRLSYLDQDVHNALKGFYERGSFWGRSNKFLVEFVEPLGNR